MTGHGSEARNCEPREEITASTHTLSFSRSSSVILRSVRRCTRCRFRAGGNSCPASSELHRPKIISPVHYTSRSASAGSADNGSARVFAELLLLLRLRFQAGAQQQGHHAVQADPYLLGLGADLLVQFRAERNTAPAGLLRRLRLYRHSLNHDARSPSLLYGPTPFHLRQSALSWCACCHDYESV